MANKTLGTRKKLSFHLESSQQLAKPRNPVAIAARLRAAGPHRKSASASRQAARKDVRHKLDEPGVE